VSAAKATASISLDIPNNSTNESISFAEYYKAPSKAKNSLKAKAAKATISISFDISNNSTNKSIRFAE
jgi:hypothetical protein